MKLDDLMEVWRSQDEAPLHGVNETLLRLALRQDEARQRSRRWWESAISTGMSAFLVAVLAVCVVVQFQRADDVRLSGWDIAVPLAGAVAIVIWPGFLRRSHREQAQREQRFGESLRDQISRQLSQLDYQARRITCLRHHVFMNLPAFAWTLAFFFTIVRINDQPFHNPWTDGKLWLVLGSSLVVCSVLVAISIGAQRRWVVRDLNPRRHRLETLLQELDDGP